MKIRVVLISIMSTIFCCLLIPTAVSAISQSQAVNWAKTQADNGVAYNVDGIYGYQCSDFGTAYINYIIFGDPFYKGNGFYTTYYGRNYFDLTYPDGWQRISNTPDFVPQAGDILCFAANSQNSAGHVAVAIEGCTVSYMNAVDQNGAANNGNGTPVRYNTLPYYSDWGDFQGVIRPKFDNGDTSAPTISNVRISNKNGASFTVCADLSDNIGVTSVWLNIYGPGGSNGYRVNASNGAFSHTINVSDYGGHGSYSVHLYAFDSAGNEGSNGISLNSSPDSDAPSINNVRITDKNGDSFTLCADLNDNVGVTSVWLNIYGPNGNNGYRVDAGNGTFAHTIKVSDYGGHGTYDIHIYVFDASGNEIGSGIYFSTLPTIEGFSISRKIIESNKPIKFSFNYTFGQSVSIAISKDGTRIANPDVTGLTQYIYRPTECGIYTAYLSVWNNAGYIDSETITFEVTSELKMKTTLSNADVYEIYSEIVNVNQSAIYYAASYASNGELIELKSKTVNCGDTECELPLSKNKDIAYIKVFLWDSNLKPLADSNTITIN